MVTGDRRVISAPTPRDLATALGIDLWGLSGDSRCDLLVVGAGPAGLAAAYAASDLETKVVSARNAVAVGGANSAGQAALFLAQHADQVHVLIRRDLADASTS